MARRRYQHPEPFVEGRFWWVLIRQDDVVNGKRTRRKKRIKLVAIRPIQPPTTQSFPITVIGYGKSELVMCRSAFHPL